MTGARRRLPPHAYFLVSAVFHYLGPALAVLLFARVAPLGVAWLRIVSAPAVFALWRRPGRLWRPSGARPAPRRPPVARVRVVQPAGDHRRYLPRGAVPAPP